MKLLISTFINPNHNYVIRVNNPYGFGYTAYYVYDHIYFTKKHFKDKLKQLYVINNQTIHNIETQ